MSVTTATKVYFYYIQHKNKRLDFDSKRKNIFNIFPSTENNIDDRFSVPNKKKFINCIVDICKTDLICARFLRINTKFSTMGLDGAQLQRLYLEGIVDISHAVFLNNGILAMRHTKVSPKHKIVEMYINKMIPREEKISIVPLMSIDLYEELEKIDIFKTLEMGIKPAPVDLHDQEHNSEDDMWNSLNDVGGESLTLKISVGRHRERGLISTGIKNLVLKCLNGESTNTLKIKGKDKNNEEIIVRLLKDYHLNYPIAVEENSFFGTEIYSLMRNSYIENQEKILKLKKEQLPKEVHHDEDENMD